MRMDLGNLVERSEERVCPVCGVITRSDVGREGRSALQKMAEHLIVHQPRPEQWNEAYENIRAKMPKKQKGTSGES